MNILGLDRNAGASKADQYVLKQSSKKLDGMLMNHAKYWYVLFTVPSSSSVSKRKMRDPIRENIFWNSISGWSTPVLHFALNMGTGRASKKTSFICK